MKRPEIYKILCAALMFCAASHASAVLSLNPADGALFGASGEVVGWGFTLTNTTNFLVVDSTDFCPGAPASPCSNPVGTYTDFAGPQFIVAGPAPENTSVTQSFDNVSQQGTGSFTINDGLPVGTTVSGNIVLTYDLFSVDPNDPNFDPGTDTISTGNLLEAPASVTVAPEPSTFLLFGASCIVGAAWRRRRVHQSRDCC